MYTFEIFGICQKCNRCKIPWKMDAKADDDDDDIQTVIVVYGLFIITKIKKKHCILDTNEVVVQFRNTSKIEI